MQVTCINISYLNKELWNEFARLHYENESDVYSVIFMRFNLFIKWSPEPLRILRLWSFLIFIIWFRIFIHFKCKFTFSNFLIHVMFYWFLISSPQKYYINTHFKIIKILFLHFNGDGNASYNIFNKIWK